MAISTTGIANRALRLLKARRITSIDDGSKNANVVSDVFDSVRDDLLRSHTWRFALRLVELGRLATAPAFKWDYAYALPSDWIRTFRVSDNDAGTGGIAYEEGEAENTGAILTSAQNVYLMYVYRVTDPNRMPPDFQTALAYALAVDMPGISNVSAAEWQLLERRASRKLIRAKSASSLGSPPSPRPTGTWSASRQAWRGPTA